MPPHTLNTAHTQTIGDNLHMAQQFIETSQKALPHIKNRLQSQPNIVYESLSAMKQGAECLNACAISDALTQTLTLLEQAPHSAQIHTQLHYIHQLLQSYKYGLAEIIPLKETQHPETTITQITPLLKYAQTPKQQTSLTSLIDYTRSNKSPTNTSTTQINLEACIPAIIQKVLSTARYQNKSISISFLTKNEHIAPIHLEFTRQWIEHIGTVLVKNCLEPRHVRQQAGLPQSGHISVRSLAPGDISVSCEGQPLNERLVHYLKKKYGICDVRYDADNHIMILHLHLPLETQNLTSHNHHKQLFQKNG